jgi:hypothetical protein
MNLYRITYGTPDSETETTNITERSETAARKAELTDAQNRRIEAEASYNSLVDRTTAAEARAEAAEDEIVTLKAKLYDYITAGS